MIGTTDCRANKKRCLIKCIIVLPALAAAVVWFFLYLLSGEAAAETYEFAICKADQPDLPSGHKRMKKGDIIAVKPFPWAWGVREMEQYLIVVVNNLTPEEVEPYMMPYYEGDVQPDPETGISPTITAKRKFNLVFEDVLSVLPAADPAKLADMHQRYQPFKDQSIILDADALPEDFSLLYNKHTRTCVKKGKKGQGK